MTQQSPLTRYIVGDRFEPFATHDTIRTVSRFVADLRADRHRDDTSLVLVEGQGLTSFDWDRIRDELDRRGLADRVRIRESDAGCLCRQTETHKHRECNVLIAGLDRVAESRFRAALRIHNDQELLLDHQGGHVQGMVVLEAARQMFVAVSERYYLSRRPERHYSFVLDSMDSKFLTFLFPLAAAIEYEVLSADLNDPAQLSFDVQVTFEQTGLPAATVRMVCGALDSSALAQKERRGTARALRVLGREMDPVPAG
ncbi:AfsA-related hotdog domain-containing protein [Streptomyces sp. V4I2]|uniref:AfsA-related hotdog domain-containing protein n=1 Tax=Streptomyces sp. V4I2 TaxID=3042280 RepID=UPI002786FE50|nr:AfsA-related hotdog domain-containing protein [Streptomyces sp. V4I2]MDQ1047473.1 hypothetical protein [Streptomyces sp. V4I2]